MALEAARPGGRGRFVRFVPGVAVEVQGRKSRGGDCVKPRHPSAASANVGTKRRALISVRRIRAIEGQPRPVTAAGRGPRSEGGPRRSRHHGSRGRGTRFPLRSPKPTARRLAEASLSAEHAPGVLRGAPPARRLARRLRARRPGPRHLPRRAPRPGERAPASASTAVAAACFRARLAREPNSSRRG